MNIENEQPEYDFHIYYHINGKYVNLSINKIFKTWIFLLFKKLHTRKTNVILQNSKSLTNQIWYTYKYFKIMWNILS